MKIDIDKSLGLPLAPDAAWAMLQDIEGVAACLPGAKITERIDDTHYKGTVTVRLGPANVAFKGAFEVVSMDATVHRMRITGKGSDAGGTSGATLDLTARIEPADGGGSMLTGRSEVSVTGKVASFGARLMNSVSEVLIQQFFDNMLARAAALQEAAPAPEAARGAEFDLFGFIWAVMKQYLRHLPFRGGEG